MDTVTLRFLQDYTVQAADGKGKTYPKDTEVTGWSPVSAKMLIDAGYADDVSGSITKPKAQKPASQITEKAEEKRAKKGGKSFTEAQEEYREEQMINPTDGPEVFGGTM